MVSCVRGRVRVAVLSGRLCSGECAATLRKRRLPDGTATCGNAWPVLRSGYPAAGARVRFAARNLSARRLRLPALTMRRDALPALPPVAACCVRLPRSAVSPGSKRLATQPQRATLRKCRRRNQSELEPFMFEPLRQPLALTDCEEFETLRLRCVERVRTKERGGYLARRALSRFQVSSFRLSLLFKFLRRNSSHSCRACRSNSSRPGSIQNSTEARGKNVSPAGFMMRSHAAGRRRSSRSVIIARFPVLSVRPLSWSPAGREAASANPSASHAAPDPGGRE